MTAELLRKLVTKRPFWTNVLPHHPCSRWSSSTASNEIKVNPAALKRYDGPVVITGISGRFPSASDNKELIEKLNIFISEQFKVHRNPEYKMESNLLESERKVTNAVMIYRKEAKANGSKVKMMGFDILKVKENY